MYTGMAKAAHTGLGVVACACALVYVKNELFLQRLLIPLWSRMAATEGCLDAVPGLTGLCACDASSIS